MATAPQHRMHTQQLTRPTRIAATTAAHAHCVVLLTVHTHMHAGQMFPCAMHGCCYTSIPQWPS
jgi:hypothetical protein